MGVLYFFWIYISISLKAQQTYKLAINLLSLFFCYFLDHLSVSIIGFKILALLVSTI